MLFVGQFVNYIGHETRVGPDLLGNTWLGCWHGIREEKGCVREKTICIALDAQKFFIARTRYTFRKCTSRFFMRAAPLE